MSAQYIIEKHEHGILVCAPEGKTGITLDAWGDIAKAQPPASVMSPGIAHHYRHWHQKNCVLAIATPENEELWRAEIDAACAKQDLSWFCGTDVGHSSAAIYAVLATDKWVYEARAMRTGFTPQDAADLGRCLRLVARYGWRDRLPEVAAAYHNTAWPNIIAEWDALAAAPAAEQTATLRRINGGAK